VGKSTWQLDGLVHRRRRPGRQRQPHADRRRGQ